MITNEDRFDFEDKITSMLNINDDLQVLMSSMYDMPDKMTEDQITNSLIGIMEMHRQRHNQLWMQMERMIKHKQLLNPDETNHEMDTTTN